MTKPLRQRLRRWGLAVVVTLLCLLIVELLLALVLGNMDVAPYQLRPGDGRCVALEPGRQTNYTGMLLRIPTVVHAVNEHGYRGPARAMQGGGALRIAALGDSFTFGQGVDERDALPAALEAELRERVDADVEVLNFGVPGLNLDEAIDQYRYFARRWQAQVVVLFLFENDLDAALCDLVDRRVFMGLLRHWRLFRLGVITLRPEALGEPDPHLSPARVEQLRDKLERLRAEVEQDGARLVIVSLADPLGDAATMNELATGLELPALVFERERFEAFETIPNETHWTVAANREVAVTVAEWLASKL